MKVADEIITKVVDVAISIVYFHMDMSDHDNVSKIVSVVEDFAELKNLT